MSQYSTIRRLPAKPIYLPRNTGSALGLEYAGVAGLAAIVIMPLFLSLAGALEHVFHTIGASL